MLDLISQSMQKNSISAPIKPYQLSNQLLQLLNLRETNWMRKPSLSLSLSLSLARARSDQKPSARL
jgi:hypothetical protein